MKRIVLYLISLILLIFLVSMLFRIVSIAVGVVESKIDLEIIEIYIYLFIFIFVWAIPWLSQILISLFIYLKTKKQSEEDLNSIKKDVKKLIDKLNN